MLYQLTYKMKNNKYDILGIGNAITDILINIDENTLDSLKIQPGSMSLVDVSFIRNILSKNKIVKTSAGGSVANTISTLAKLGIECSFAGIRKNDEYGKLFSSSMQGDSINLINNEKKEGLPSSICLVMVTPNGERTMCTYLGASGNLKNEDINQEILDKHKIVYLEGYLFDLPEAKNIFFDIVTKSKKENFKVALSLSDGFCVDRHREEFKELINLNIDILFSNEQEIESLFEKDFTNSLKEAGNKVDTTIVTRGNKGAALFKNSKLITVDAIETEVLDTTGAGDNFAAGYLYAFLNNLSIDTCLKAGVLCATDVIKYYGARTDNNIKDLFKEHNIIG